MEACPPLPVKMVVALLLVLSLAAAKKPTFLYK
jgi:hypothetical protein